MRIIAGESDIRDGVQALVVSCPDIARVHALVGPPPLRRREGGFAGLAQVITAQQLSVASADAIWTRLQAAVQPFDAARFLAMPDAALRAAGLSAGKIATLRGVAKAIDGGALDLAALEHAPEAELVAAQRHQRGIGPWTVDIYAMFCLGRADAWSPGDLALQYAVQDALSLETRPDPGEMREIAERWRPWRGVAARLLWAYYAARKAAAKSNSMKSVTELSDG